MPKSLPDNLIGDTPEVQGLINNIKCSALVDTGSQVTTISHSFYKRYLAHVPIQSCSSLLRVEGVGGESLPYIGYIEAVVSVPVDRYKYFTVSIPILLVLDTTYNVSLLAF